MSSTPRAAADADAVRASVLGPTSLWRRFDVLTETGSTNADLIAHAAAGEDIVGTVLLAEFQNAGRGRHGRRWSAPPRSQIAMSVGVDASDIPVDSWGWLPLLTGLAVAETVRNRYGVDAGLKWPNDVLVDSGKLAGILTEVARPDAVIVVGLGLNVSLAADEAPDPSATSLAMLGHPHVDRTKLVIELLRAVDSRVCSWREARGGYPALVADYRRFSTTIGTRVRAILPGDSEIIGTAAGIDDCGRLLLDDGVRTVTISAGDITHLRPATPTG